MTPRAPPSPQAILAARLAAGLTMREAAELVGRSLRTWAYWESGEVQMEPVLWLAFRERTRRRTVPKPRADRRYGVKPKTSAPA